MIMADPNIMGVRSVEEGIGQLYTDYILLLSHDPLKSLPPLMSIIQLYKCIRIQNKLGEI